MRRGHLRRCVKSPARLLDPNDPAWPLQHCHHVTNPPHMTAVHRMLKTRPRVSGYLALPERLPWALLFAASLAMFTVGASGTTRAPFLRDMARDLAVGVPLVANLVAASSISWGITSILAGMGSDRWGRRKFLVGGPAALVFAAIGIATSASFVGVAIWVTIAGAFCGLFSGVIFNEVSARVAPTLQGRALGWVMSGQSLTLLIGVPLAAWVGAYIGWRGVNLCIAGFALLTALGKPASLSPDDARIEANRIKGQAASGADPAEAEAERRQRGATLQRLAADYEKALQKRPKMRGSGLPSPEYVADEMTQVRLSLADMEAEALPAANLTVQHIRQLLYRTEGAAAPRARFGALHRFCDWLQDAGHIQANPCMQIARSRRPKAPPARAHYLTPAELGRLWRAAGSLRKSVWRDLARFLIAVPCRRGEAARMDWSQVDLDATEWRQPSYLTKNRDPHRLHLHPLALDVLKARQQAAAKTQANDDPEKVARILAAGRPRSGLVFPAPISGGVVDTFSDLKAGLTKATCPKEGEHGAVLDGWTWHDFRRSFATALGEAGVPEAVADAVLNHRQAATRGGVLGVYQRSSRRPEQVKAMQFWGRLLATTIDGAREAGAEVVQLHANAS